MRVKDSNAKLLVNQRQLAWFLAVLVALTTVSGGLADFLIHRVVADPQSSITKLLNRFDLGHEPSLPSFLSGLGLFCCAGMLLLLFKLESPTRWTWLGLGLLFVVLSCDEVIMLHEMINRPLLAAGLGRWLLLPWVLVGAIFVLIVGIGCVPLLLSLDRRTRRYFVTSAVIFVFGALGMEMVASVIYSGAGSEEIGIHAFAHVISQTIEEGCEMAGIALFFWALVDYAFSRFGSVQIERASDDSRRA